MKVAELARRFDDRLRIEDFADIDPSANGLQVGDGTAEVVRAAFAVDAGLGTIDAAAEAEADVLCVHHGLIWDGLDRVTGRAYDRLEALVETDIALYVAHLPLDAHPELGNAAGLAEVLGLEATAPFGQLGSETVGLRGRLVDGPISPEVLADRMADGLEGDGSVRPLAFGPEAIDTLGIVTGSGADWLDESTEAGLDALVTGEGKQALYHQARDAGATVLVGGHYATETFGVRSLEAMAAEWGLATTYIEWPTGF